MSKKSLQNKVIIVTGGSGGIGGAIVKSLSYYGANVVSIFCANHPEDQADENIICLKANLTIPAEWDRLLSFTISKFGRIDVLINCAGILEPGKFTSLDNSQISRMIDLNLTSVLTGIHKSLVIMKNQKAGHIVNISSIGGLVPMPYSAVYSATKFAIRGFTFSLAQELKDSGIKLSLITPGAVSTKMLYDEAQDKNTSIAFVSDPISPDEVSNIVLKVICKPKIEIIIPKDQALSSKLITYSPSLFSKFYNIIHKVGLINKRRYLKRNYAHLTAKGVM